MRHILWSTLVLAAVGWPLPARALPLGVGIGLRIGGAANKGGGLLAGVDVTLPTLSLRPGLKGRVDLDTWGQPTSGWDRSSGGRTATFCQLVDGIVGYYGAGVGYARIRSGGTTYEGPELKLVAGMNLLGMGFEANWHQGRVSVWTGMVRMRF